MRAVLSAISLSGPTILGMVSFGSTHLSDTFGWASIVGIGKRRKALTVMFSLGRNGVLAVLVMFSGRILSLFRLPNCYILRLQVL